MHYAELDRLVQHQVCYVWIGPLKVGERGMKQNQTAEVDERATYFRKWRTMGYMVMGCGLVAPDLDRPYVGNLYKISSHANFQLNL